MLGLPSTVQQLECPILVSYDIYPPRHRRINTINVGRARCGRAVLAVIITAYSYTLYSYFLLTTFGPQVCTLRFIWFILDGFCDSLPPSFSSFLQRY
jgi:hypothetical protein